MKSLIKGHDLRGARLAVLRNMEGLSQTGLAQAMGVTQGFISKIESGVQPLPANFASSLVSQYDLPLKFFEVPPSLATQSPATFRKSSRATVHEERRVAAHFDEAARLFHQASEASGYRVADLSSLFDSEVSAAAQNVRTAFGVSSIAPVLNVVRSVERLGVGVVTDLVTIPNGVAQHSGISRPNRELDRPLIATIGDLPPAVARMTILHELGHLIFDRDRLIPITKRQAPEEKRAFRFAASVLIPDVIVRQQISETLTLQGFLPLKAKYGISVAALIVQAAALKAISPQRQRSLFIQLSSLGWRRHEPVPVAKETPILLRQASERGISPDARVIAEQTGVKRDLVLKWTGIPPTGQQSGLADIIELRPRR